jgi:hypothetical protein
MVGKGMCPYPGLLGLLKISPKALVYFGISVHSVTANEIGVFWSFLYPIRLSSNSACFSWLDLN